ncbi:hypothetical protein [Paraburkholderia sp. ZP32-5]|uniref:hypothetical protein n=1 Tax=Paraburkholderia sp. ZP32-5 TaxID=2883245 RepID=UPI001F27CC00|nr:hypothetical protein [Paraburkholderia sp. ZP32-5]
MNTPKLQTKRATLVLTPHPKQQTKDDVHAVVDEILKRSGCMTCGLIALFHVEFGGDPGPDMIKRGVIAANYENA